MASRPTKKCADLEISVCSDSELRVRDNCQSPPSVEQKIVSVEPGPEETHWTFPQLLDLACFLHDANEFKTQKFEKHAHLITNLGWTLVHHGSNRAKIVTAMKAIMKAWMDLCENDATCILPPDLKTLQDPQTQKVLAKIAELERMLLKQQEGTSEQVTDLQNQLTTARALAK